jgi:hypothetical protein
MIAADGQIKKQELNQEFTAWYQSTIGRNVPSPREVHAYMDKKFGKYDKHGSWKGARIKYDCDAANSDDDMEEDMEEISENERIDL